MARRGIPVPDDVRERFLEKFAECGIMLEATRAVGVDRNTPYGWCEQDEDFAAKFKEAQDSAADLLEAEARRRAMEGVLEPVFYKGKLVKDDKTGEPLGIRRYSDTLLIVGLKMKGRFVERRQNELMGEGGGPIKSEVTGRLAGLSDAELLELAGEDE